MACCNLTDFYMNIKRLFPLDRQGIEAHKPWLLGERFEILRAAVLLHCVFEFAFPCV